MADDGDDGGLTDRFGHEIPEDEERRKPIERKRFLLSFTTSLLFAVFVIVLTFSYTQTGAMAVTGVGGFALNITEIQGDQIQFYAEPVETAACRADINDTEVVQPNERAFIGLAADVDSILIPAYSTLNLTKDIDLSSGALDMGTLEGVRIRLFRPDVPDESAVTFPPSASASNDISVGDVRQSYVDRVELTQGINVRVGSDDGYGDYRFERTTPIQPGETRDITVTAHGYNDWSPAVAANYPLADGVRRDRHITNVQLQDLDKTNTQTDSGYTDYTGFNNTAIGEGQPGFESGRFLRRGQTHSMTVDAVGAAPDFGALDTVRSDPDHDVALPSPLSGDLSAQSYIDDVQFQNIGDTGTGDNGGYKAEWSPTSGTLTPGNTYQLSVSGVRRSGTWGDAAGLSATASGTQNADYGISDTQMTGVTINANGDQTATTAGLQTARAGDFITVSACVTTTSSSHKKDLISGDVTEPGVTVGKAFFDWDDDDTAEADVVIGVHVEAAQDTTSTDCFTAQQQIPNDVSPGTGTVRFMTQGAAVDGRDDGDGPDNVPPSSDWGPTGQTNPRNFQGEYIDRTIWIQQRSQVSAFFDWDQNGVFEHEVPLYDDDVTQTGTWSPTVDVPVPEDAVAGSTAMRVVHRNEKASIETLVDPDQNVSTYVGETQDYTVEVAASDTDASVNAFFDWNQDGEFEDRQLIDTATSPTGAWTANGDIQVPPDAKAGATAMRVAHEQDGYAGLAVDLALRWPFNEGSGTTANDYSGNGNDGTISGAATWIAGQEGSNALSLDGTDDEVANANLDGFPTGPDVTHTMSAWIRPDDQPTNREWVALLGPASGGSHHWLVNAGGGGTVSAQFGAWGGPQVSPTLPTGTWTHVTVTYDGTEVRLYEDGQLTQTVPAPSGSFDFGTSEFDVGRAHIGENNFDGDVDDVRVYERALTDAEARQLYLQSQGNSYPVPGPDDVVNGEYHDYTAHVESEGSFLRAWVDWNNNGTWTPVADFGIGNVGYGEGNFQNEGGFSLSDQITVPGNVNPEPVHLLRVTHEQAVPASAGGGPPVPAEGRGGWKGETLDYTVVTDPAIDIFQYENVSLGSVTFKLSELSLEDANLTGDVVLDERYTDDTLQNPQFGPDGQFLLAGDDMTIKGVTGRAHLVQFSFFNIPGIRIEVELVDDWDNYNDPVLGGSTTCPPLP